MMNKYQLTQDEIEVLNQQIIEQYCIYSNINIDYNISPEYQNKNGDTIALWIAQQQLTPPKQWYHEPTIKNKDNQTVALYLIRDKIEVPLLWRYYNDKIDNKDISIFLICVQNRLQPQQWCCTQYRNGSVAYCNGNSYAMILAWHNIEIPQFLYHKPNQINEDFQTVAMIQASQGKIPDKQWIHNKYMRCYGYHENYQQQQQYRPCSGFGFTVQNILELKHMEVPEEWKYTYLNENEDTQAILDAQKGIIPEIGDNDPLYSNKKCDTVAIILAKQGIIPPKQWMHIPLISNLKDESIQSLLEEQFLPLPYHWHDNDITIFDRACYGEIPELGNHKPDEQNKDGFTIAMILAMLDKEIPKEWYHDPKLQSKRGWTVATIFANKGIIPPEQWMHDIDFNCNKFSSRKIQSIRSLLYDTCYVYQDNHFIPNYKTQISDETCQLCFNSEMKIFIITKCKHSICLDCFKKLIKYHRFYYCPICGQKDWFEQIQQVDYIHRIKVALNLVPIVPQDGDGLFDFE